MMANWLRGGFEMDRKGNWRLKPQMADTLQRDVQAVMAQTGWSRSIDRSSQDQLSQGTDINLNVSAAAGSSPRGGSSSSTSSGGRGAVGGSVGFQSSDKGVTSEAVNARLDIMNYQIRQALAASERGAATATKPEHAFVDELSKQVFGPAGLRNSYLEDADGGRATFDATGPITSIEQKALLDRGRFSTDIGGSPLDGNSEFKKR